MAPARHPPGSTGPRHLSWMHPCRPGRISPIRCRAFGGPDPRVAPSLLAVERALRLVRSPRSRTPRRPPCRWRDAEALREALAGRAPWQPDVLRSRWSPSPGPCTGWRRWTQPPRLQPGRLPDRAGRGGHRQPGEERWRVRSAARPRGVRQAGVPGDLGGDRQGPAGQPRGLVVARPEEPRFIERRPRAATAATLAVVLGAGHAFDLPLVDAGPTVRAPGAGRHRRRRRWRRPSRACFKDPAPAGAPGAAGPGPDRHQRAPCVGALEALVAGPATAGEALDTLERLCHGYRLAAAAAPAARRASAPTCWCRAACSPSWPGPSGSTPSACSSGASAPCARRSSSAGRPPGPSSSCGCSRTTSRPGRARPAVAFTSDVLSHVTVLDARTGTERTHGKKIYALAAVAAGAHAAAVPRGRPGQVGVEPLQGHPQGRRGLAHGRRGPRPDRAAQRRRPVGAGLTPAAAEQRERHQRQ